MTTAAARTDDVRTEPRAPASAITTKRADTSRPAGLPRPEDDTGAWLVTGVVLAFFATIAVVFWMAHTIQV